ncbi:MAG TPA: dihydrofolate reductase family protein [Thermoleophilaceae bacterium]|jgi:dihydrofolate reductase|nr:dihydrofolate reductase family protein [Thermoleophilaceae bacterium]
MSRVVVINNLSLDGVMQAPGRADEDTRGAFEHGGWAVPYQAMGSLMGKRAGRTRGLLLGRRTYEDFAGFWPKQTDNPFTEVMDNTQKYVASRTLAEPLPWVNSTLLEGDAADAVAELKAEPDGDLVVLGSGELVRSLMQHSLVDEYALLIHPLVLGSGRRLFADHGTHASLRLVESETTDTGVLIGTYRPA